MRESDPFMAIIDEGREIEARRLVRLLAEEHLGVPDEQSVTRLESVADIDRLERIIRQVGKAPTWQALLDTP